MAPEKVSSENSDALSRNVLRLGWISLLNDLGSEVVTRLIPLYVTGILGAPMSAVGTIEGLAEATATLLKPVFGRWSDRLTQRKPFIIVGYSLSSIARPLLAWAGSWHVVAYLRVLDRLGKGIRTAPRDALIANSSHTSKLGRNFGVNRALDTLGALLGVAGFALWAWKSDETRLDLASWKYLTWLCVIPGVMTVGLAAWGIREAVTRRPSQQTPNSIAPPLSIHFKRYLLVIAVFGLANSSDAFILLRARELGFSLPEILGTVALLNIVSTLTTIPAAAVSDFFGRRSLIACGWTVYAVAYLILGSVDFMDRGWIFAATVALYGLFYGFTESVERAWIADLVPAEDRGRAYGIFSMIAGIVALPASAGFGWIWDQFGSEAAFLSGSAIALFATALLFVLMPRHRPQTV